MAQSDSVVQIVRNSGVTTSTSGATVLVKARKWLDSAESHWLASIGKPGPNQAVSVTRENLDCLTIVTTSGVTIQIINSPKGGR